MKVTAIHTKKDSPKRVVRLSRKLNRKYRKSLRNN